MGPLDALSCRSERLEASSGGDPSKDLASCCHVPITCPAAQGDLRSQGTHPIIAGFTLTGQLCRVLAAVEREQMPTLLSTHRKTVKMPAIEGVFPGNEVSLRCP